MAVFTTTPKRKLNFPAPPSTSATYFLKISDSFFLDIGSGYKLIINRGGRTENVWTKITKTR